MVGRMTEKKTLKEQKPLTEQKTKLASARAHRTPSKPLSGRNAAHAKAPFTPSRDLIHRLPKTDLHVHLDGSMRLETILELADTRGVKLPADTP